MRAFEAEMERVFVRRLAAYLKEKYPDAVAGHGERLFEARVGGGVRRARVRGFSRDEDVVTFVSLLFTVGPDFDTHPRIAAVLGDERVPPEGRMARLAAQVRPEHWEEAARRSDPRAWKELE